MGGEEGHENSGLDEGFLLMGSRQQLKENLF